MDSGGNSPRQEKFTGQLSQQEKSGAYLGGRVGKGRRYQRKRGREKGRRHRGAACDLDRGSLK